MPFCCVLTDEAVIKVHMIYICTKLSIHLIALVFNIGTGVPLGQTTTEKVELSAQAGTIVQRGRHQLGDQIQREAVRVTSL